MCICVTDFIINVEKSTSILLLLLHSLTIACALTQKCLDVLWS